MFTPWILLLIATASAADSETSTEPNTNVTTLYPVSNKTIIRSDAGARPNSTNTTLKPQPQTWKIESGFAESNLTGAENNKTNSEGKEKEELIKDFKPSQHLGSFFDEDSAEIIKTPIFGHIQKKPASGFVSSTEDYHNHPSFNNIPKEIYYTHKEYPYKFEDTYTRTQESWPDPQPTVEAPVKIPAGGFYKSPDAFKERPHSEEDVGLQYHKDGEENGIKKRVNPWQNLLRLVTAFIPVGLIISALTPSIITIHNVDDNQQPTSLPYRRSDPGGGAGLAGIEGGVGGAGAMAPISERCRRRLLCELHSERNYGTASSKPRRTKPCYKIQCEDTEALWRMLRWLFTYNQGTDDKRGRFLT